MFHLLTAFAEFEPALIRERVTAGLANARAKGKVLGRPRRMIDHAQLVARRNGGASFRRIAKETGIPTTSVRRALQA
jgi:DNA invertase Pin-like site-specific DNA recombinase